MKKNETIDTLEYLFKNVKEREFALCEDPEEYEQLVIDYDLFEKKINITKDLIINDSNEFVNYSILRILNISGIGERLKMKLISSFGVLYKDFRFIPKRSFEEILLLAEASIYTDINDYTFYIGILADQQVIKSIIEKTSDPIEQNKIAFEIMNSQSEFYEDDINSDNYDDFVDMALNIIHTYNSEKKR